MTDKAKGASPDRWRMGFHLMPPAGWLNDPNGLCQFKGVYHVFHQYSPAWPEPGAPRGWGHATSRDLVHWTHHGMAVAPDTPEDATGAYSGSAVVVPGAAGANDDVLRIYYTGNVKEPGDHDYVHTGRQANEIMIESADGFTFSEKRVLMRNADYPRDCTLHVRDPKVWRQAGAWWMLLGARRDDDAGEVLVYRSEDGVGWSLWTRLSSSGAFGFMWECPDRIELDGHEYLSLCPQGMEGRGWSHGLRDQAGYVPLADGARVIDGSPVDTARFVRWDHGFDFYAPQTFVDDAGRTILIGWMGMPLAPYESAPGGLSWCHCLTVPRELSRAADGRISQRPVEELATLRGADQPLRDGQAASMPGRRADIEICGAATGFALVLDDVVELSVRDGVLSLAFLDAAVCGSRGVGAGRVSRSCLVSTPVDVRVLVDDSAIEVFADEGRVVFATRWFPTRERLSVMCVGPCRAGHVWAMGDGMAGTYGAA